jgi:hypothetical protein
MVSIQSSYTSPSKCKCSSPFKNLVSCSFLTSYLYSFECLSCENVIFGTSCLCSFNCSSYGDVIYGTFVVYLVTCTIVGTTHTIVRTINGSTLPFMIFYALAFMLSYSLFTLEHEAFPSQLCYSF